MNDQSTGNTGTKDRTFDLVSILYHSLQGAETISKYLENSEQNDGGDLDKFFRETKEQNSRCADRAKELLIQHLGQTKTAEAGR